jgi:hypothetical protein
VAGLAQIEARRRGEPQLEHHRAEEIAVRIGVLLHHALGRQTLQHAVHRRTLQAGAGGEIEQARTAAVVGGDLAQQRQRTLDALRAGEAGTGRGFDLARHGEVRIVNEPRLCHQ